MNWLRAYGVGAVLLALGMATASQGATVLVDYGPAWAGGAAGNQATIDFFGANFLDTTVASGDFSDTANASVRTAISNATVLVLTRTTSSAAYDTNDAAFYSGLTIPVIDLTSYTARSNRLYWTSGDIAAQTIDGDEATVTAAGAAVFGVAANYDWYNGSGSFDAAGTGGVGGGQILATIGSGHFVVGWQVGDAVASGAVQSGKRLLFNISGNGNNLPNTTAGLQALKDAITAYTSLVKATNAISTAGLPVIEAESAAPLGTNFSINTLIGATNITISPTGGGDSPGGNGRVATYSVTFPAAGSYFLYARVYVGAGTFNDDSFFYAASFGAKSATNGSEWITVNGLAGGSVGFTNSTDVVTGGGSGPGSGAWKWINVSQYNDLEAGVSFTVTEGSLTQTFQVGGREDGLYLDKLVFGPSDVALTVSNLDSGTLPQSVYSTNTFDGPLGDAIHRFDEPLNGLNRDGINPVGLAMFGNGLSGATFGGGSQGDGTVFTMNLEGTSFNTVVAFSSTVNAGNPQAGPTASSGSGFFGAAAIGGANKIGAIFAGQTNGTITLLRSFNALSTDRFTNVGGAYPCTSVTLSGGTLYGTASAGGANGKGTLFSLATNGTGFTVLHEFGLLDVGTGTNVDGAIPRGGLLLSGGTLYGTASGGGANGAGVVFSLNTNGTGFTILHHFAAMDTLSATNADGAFPCSDLVLSSNVLFGTTLAGGPGGRGTVFTVGTNGSGFAVLHAFQATAATTGINSDGASPVGGLILSGNVLYGNASAGGTGGAGTVFSLDVAGPVFKTIYNFEPVTGSGTNTFGAYPVSPLVRVGNALYGAAFGGGPGGAGTIFRVPLAPYAAVPGFSDGNVIVSFVGAPNSTNVVQATDDLSAQLVNWQNISTNIADASGWWQVIESVSQPHRFYRAQPF
jgi:uncharacterized repeat protein (TIGR03803 family)